MEWFLVIMCKEHTHRRFANGLGRNHPIQSWLRNITKLFIINGYYTKSRRLLSLCSLFLLFLLVNRNTLELPVSLHSAQSFWNIGEFGAKKNFADHRTVNLIQLFVEIFLVYSFCWTSRREGEFPRDYSINVLVYLHINLHTEIDIM